MAIRDIANIVGGICSSPCCGGQNILCRVRCQHCVEKICVICISYKCKYWNTCQSSNSFLILTTFYSHIISFDFCPCLFKNRAPNRWVARSGLSKCWKAKGWLSCFIWNSILIIHIQIVIDSYGPWSPSNVKIHSINWSIIFCLSYKCILYQRRKLSATSRISDPIAVSKHKLNILSEINRSIRRKKGNIWPSCWPSLPPVTRYVPWSNRRCISESIPKYCHRCIEGCICPLSSIANCFRNIWWASFQSSDRSRTKRRNLFNHGSMSKPKFFLSIKLIIWLVMKKMIHLVSLFLFIKFKVILYLGIISLA